MDEVSESQIGGLVGSSCETGSEPSRSGSEGVVSEVEVDSRAEAEAEADAVADAKEEEAEGRRASGVMVVWSVSQWSEGVGERCRSPRPSTVGRAPGRADAVEREEVRCRREGIMPEPGFVVRGRDERLLSSVRIERWPMRRRGGSSEMSTGMSFLFEVVCVVVEACRLALVGFRLEGAVV